MLTTARLVRRTFASAFLICITSWTFLQAFQSPIIVTAAPFAATFEETKTDESPRVVINEIFYHAPDSNENLEWIEIHNSGDEAVDLSGWKITGGVEFEFSETGSEIGAGGFLVICKDKKTFSKFYEASQIGEFSKSLSNSGERLELVNRDGTVVDMVEYQDSGDWPVAADGYSSSLERICPLVSAENAGNWTASPLPDEFSPAGTPGQQNSTYSKSFPPMISDVAFTPVQPRPGQPVEVSATIKSSTDLKNVKLMIWTVQPGAIKKQADEEMTMSQQGKFTGEIPAFPANQLVRFQVVATDQSGAIRSAPPSNSLRPAYSYYTQDLSELSGLPQAIIMNADPVDSAYGRRYRNGAVQGTGPMGRGTESLRRLESILGGGLNLFNPWFAVSKESASEDEEFRDEVRAVFQASLKRRDAIANDSFAAEDPRSAIREVTPKIKKFRADLTKELGSEFAELESVKLYGFNEPRFPSWARGVFDVKSAWLALNLRYRLTNEQFIATRNLVVESHSKWLDLHDDAVAVRSAKAFGEFNEKVDVLKQRLLDSAGETLDRRQLNYLRSCFAEPDQRPLRLGGDPRPVTPRGHSAFIVVDPTRKSIDIFDFVNAKRRTEGYKVRFTKDRLWRQMSVANIVFEYKDRFVLAEFLAYDLYQRLGMAASLADFVNLTIDGQQLGYHLVFEQPNRAFLRRNSINPDGDLFKIEWRGQTLETAHSKKTNLSTGHERLKEVIQSLAESTEEEQWQVIQNNFNVDQIINYFVANMVLSHWDGYFNNYFAYHDLNGHGKFEMYPWDQDKTWGFHDSLGEDKIFFDMAVTFGMEGDPSPHGGDRINFRHWWRQGGYFSKPLLSNPEFRKKFLVRLRVVLDTVYTEEVFFPVIDELATRIRPEVVRRAEKLNHDVEKATRRFERNIATFKEHLEKRRDFLLDQDELKTLGK